MKFVMIGWDGPEGQAKQKVLRPAHRERLKQLESKGKFILAGPFEDRSGSLIVIEADSAQEARAIVQMDPYVEQGVFGKVEIRPFIQVFPADEVKP